MTQIPPHGMDVDIPDWAGEEDFAEGVLTHKDDLQELLEQFGVSMAARKYSFTRKTMAHLECQETKVFPKPNDLDFKIVERVRHQQNQKRRDIATELYKKFNSMNEILAPKDHSDTMERDLAPSCTRSQNSQQQSG